MYSTSFGRRAESLVTAPVIPSRVRAVSTAVVFPMPEGPSITAPRPGVRRLNRRSEYSSGSYLFAEHRYELRGNSVGIEVAGTFIQVTAIAGQSPSDVLMALAGIIEERGYQECAFPEPNWKWLANEERIVPSKHERLNHNLAAVK
jgi:hypothetical protein